MLSNKKGALKEAPFLFIFMKGFLNNIDLIIGQY